MTALSVGMGCHKIRAISRQFSRQFHTRAVYPRYVLLVVSRKLLWRETLRNKKRLIFSLSSGPMNPLQSFLAPGLGSARAIDRKIRQCSRPLRALFSVFSAPIGGIDNRTHGVGRPSYLHDTHSGITANILDLISVALSSTDLCEFSRVSSALCSSPIISAGTPPEFRCRAI